MHDNNELHLSAYDYSLPEGLIAQVPSEKRDGSRLLVLERSSGAVLHRRFSDIAEYVRPGDCLVVNRTKVLPVRIFGRKETGGKAEILFLDPLQPHDGKYAVLLRPYMLPGKRVLLPEGTAAVVEGKNSRGEAVISVAGLPVPQLLEKHGVMPLPPYIKRTGGAAACAGLDRERYQTVYAREQGSIAAPTAGLHFTEELLEALRKKGCDVAEVMLHVGWGTFRPITAEDISRHSMLPERFEIDAPSAERINRCRAGQGRIIAVGTTSVRTLESAALQLDIDRGKGELAPLAGATELFIYPGHHFRIVDAMVTNFHLPRSTPLVMVSALAGRETVLKAYGKAVAENYRFYSYGDAMLIL